LCRGLEDKVGVGVGIGGVVLSWFFYERIVVPT